MATMTASNASFIPSARDLLLVFPRLAQRAGSFAVHMPEAMEDLAGKIFYGGSAIADATGTYTTNVTMSNTSAAVVQSTAAILEGALKEGWIQDDETSSSIFGMVLQVIGRLKNFGGIFSYLTSRWALATFTAAVILNRAQFYASSREHLQLRWYVRLAIYGIPLVSFMVQLITILEAMRCQTSPDFAEIRYGDPLKTLILDFGGESGFLYNLSSRLLFWQDDATACQKRNMSLVALDGDRMQLRGTMSLLFRFFLTLCTSQLFETLACALQGRQPMPETGMTIFEHSLAFAECEAMMSSALGFGFFGASKLEPTTSGGTSHNGPLMTRSEIMQRLNVPPEVLLVCLISSFSHMSSVSLAVLGIRDKVRLFNTGIWGICYMAAFVWSFLRIFMLPIEDLTDVGVLRFPTVCIVGFIPHVLILLGIVSCSVIYGIALVLTAFSIPDDASTGLTFRQRLTWAYRNLQANVQFSQSSAIRIKMSEDFYTTLLKIGFTVLTAASEAVYLNEGSRIQVAQRTWLEQQRIDQMASGIDRRKRPKVPAELLGEGIARGVDFVDQQHAAISQSPYARERRSKPRTADAEKSNTIEVDSGLGLAQRRGRMQLTMDFVAGIFWLIVGLQANLLLSTLQKLRIQARPSWLLKAAGASGSGRSALVQAGSVTSDECHFLQSPEGNLIRPLDLDTDVEHEVRKSYQESGNHFPESTIGDQLYMWWRAGGYFGDVDSSGDYEAQEADDDVSSVISMSTNASMSDEWSDVDDSGRRTPTQRDPFGGRSREATPSLDGGIDTGLLSRLLDPQTAAEREEARLLSHSLQSNRPMTRSQYQRTTERERAQLLRSAQGASLTADDEERDLEHFILSQRSKGRARNIQTGGKTWETGAEGMGDGGPQCVVCQSAPRTILVWPCSCLCMCDDCRVGLAARNYTKCICCRTDIAAYSRLYVP